MCCRPINTVVGVDALPGREGGTWFGMSSKFAKIGALLNIFEPDIDTSKRPRGPLVPDYLQTEQDAGAYIKTVAQHREEFNQFNLVLLERWFVQLLVICIVDFHYFYTIYCE